MQGEPETASSTDGRTVLIVDPGARGHVLSRLYEEDPIFSRVIVIPGNDYIGHNRKGVIVEKEGSHKDPQSVLRVVRKYGLTPDDVIDVAQDDALSLGTVDLLIKEGHSAFGPTAKKARLESSKSWSRGFMKRHNIPHPHFEVFEDANQVANSAAAHEYVNQVYASNPTQVLFVKADGLAAGKGALKATNMDEALAKIDEMESFGKAGKTFVIEHALEGEEFSGYFISDGQVWLPLGYAQDHKLIGRGDTGAQTGGMGAYSHPMIVTSELVDNVERLIVAPTIAGMADEGLPYTGILYVGGMVNVDDKGNPVGTPSVVEFNARFGDPEMQAIPRLKNYPRLVLAVLDGRLGEVVPETDSRHRFCVVAASKGYPGDYGEVKGKEIFGLDTISRMPGVELYSAGITVKDGRFYAAGGRLASIVGIGDSFLGARERAYAAASHFYIEGNNQYFRSDLGWRDMARLARQRKL